MMRLFLLSTLMVAMLGGSLPAPPYPFDLESRLSTLRPERPRAYFELGEEVLDVADSDVERRDLARRLFGIAGTLDPEGLGASSALALAAMADDAAAARRFRIAARLLSDDVAWTVRRGRKSLDREIVTQICRSLEDLRTGDSNRLRTVFRDPEKIEALARWDAVIPGGVAWLRQLSERRGGTRIDLDLEERLALVNVEIALLEGADASWATLLTLEAPRPLMNLPLDRPERVLLPDGGADAPYWRRGAWSDRP